MNSPLRYLSSLLFSLSLTASAQTFTEGDYQLNRKKATSGFEVAELLAGSNITITWNNTNKTATLAGNPGTITTFAATDSTGIDFTVTNPTTTPTLSLALTKAAVGLTNVENTALSTWAGSTNLTTLGVLNSVLKVAPTGGGNGELWLWDGANGEYSVLNISDAEWTFDGDVVAPNFRGVWAGSAIADGSIASAATWNAKQAAGNYLTALTGDVTATGPGSVAATIAHQAVTFAKMQHISTAHLLGRHSSGSGDVQQINIDGGLELQGANLRRAAFTGDVTASAGSNTTTLANTAVTPASYTNANITVDAKGRITAAANGTGGGVTSVTGTGTVNGLTLSGTVTSTGNLTLGGTLSGVSLTSAVSGILPVANGGVHPLVTTGDNGSGYGRIGLWDDDAGDWIYFSAGPANIIFPDIQATSFSGDGNGITSLNAGNISTGTLGVARGGTGANTLTANNVLLGNGTSPLQAVAPGTNGNVLTSDGTTWTSTAPTGATYATNLQARQGISTTTAISPATLWNALHDSLFIADFARFLSTTTTGSGSVLTTGANPYPQTGATANSTSRGQWITHAKSGSSTWGNIDYSRPSAFGLALTVGSSGTVSTGIFRVWIGTDTNASSIAARGYGFEIRQHRLWIITHNGTTLATQDTGTDISSTSFVLNVLRCVNDGAGNITLFLNNAQIGTALTGGPTTAGTGTLNILNLNGATAAANDIRTLAGTFTANIY